MQRISGLWKWYVGRISGNSAKQEDINDWRDRLFASFLTYCLPISLIAVIPGIYMSFGHHFIIVGIADVIGFLLLAFVTLNQSLSFATAKHLVIGLFYSIAIILIANLGYIGPGVFYLFWINYSHRNDFTNPVCILVSGE